MGSGPIKKVFPQDELQKAFQQPLQLHAVSADEIKEEPEYMIKKTWRDLHEWDRYSEREGWFKGFEKVQEDVQQNNELLLAVFEDYLEHSEKLKGKTIENHVFNVGVYLNDFLLYYGIHTALTDTQDLEDFLSDWFPSKAMWSSPATVKKTGASLKKFYRFLNKADVITKKELKDAQDKIWMGVEVGASQLELIEDGFYDDFY